MAIGVMLLAAVYGVFAIQNARFATEEQIAEMQQNARAAIDLMSREIRMVGYDPDGDLSANIITATAGTLSFSMDVDGGGGVYAPVTVTYNLDTTNRRITRTYGGSGSQPMAENIDNLQFKYYDSSGTETAVVSKICQIQIDLTARTSRADPKYSLNGGYRTCRLTSMVKARNLAL
jgi:type IV pilus assembly protein PilW